MTWTRQQRGYQPGYIGVITFYALFSLRRRGAAMSCYKSTEARRGRRSAFGIPCGLKKETVYTTIYTTRHSIICAGRSSTEREEKRDITTNKVSTFLRSFTVFGGPARLHDRPYHNSVGPTDTALFFLRVAFHAEIDATAAADTPATKTTTKTLTTAKTKRLECAAAANPSAANP
jgi:hypothetical protein